MKSYWDLSQDTKAQIHYKVNLEEGIEDKGILQFIDTILKIGKETRLLELRADEDVAEISTFIEKLYSLKESNRFSLIPRISNNKIHNFSSKDSYSYEICPRIVIDNSKSKCLDLEEVVLKRDEIEKFLSKANSKLKVQNIAFVALNTYYQMSKGLPISIECTMNFNSDIWLDKVPCNHCLREYSNEDLRNKGGVSSVVEFWKDNSILAMENIGLLSPFLDKMKSYVEENEGEITIDVNSTFEDSFFSGIDC